MKMLILEVINFFSSSRAANTKQVTNALFMT